MDEPQTYDFAKLGRMLHAYPVTHSLGFQRFFPVKMMETDEVVAAHSVQWKDLRFLSANRDQVPRSSGVYVFFVDPMPRTLPVLSAVLYIGSAENLKARYVSYVRERKVAQEGEREKVSDMLKIYRDRVRYAFIETDIDEARRIERLLIAAVDPCCNIRGRSQPPSPAFP